MKLFTLEGYEDGKCVFTDKLNKIRREFVCEDVRPRTLYNISIFCFGRLEQDVKNNSLMLVLNAGAVQEGRQIFGFAIEFIYDGKAFVPSQVVSNDWKRFSTDKEGGKEIRSMSDYRYFEYTWENKDIEKKVYGLFDGDKTSEANVNKFLTYYLMWIGADLITIVFFK